MKLHAFYDRDLWNDLTSVSEKEPMFVMLGIASLVFEQTNGYTFEEERREGVERVEGLVQVLELDGDVVSVTLKTGTNANFTAAIISTKSKNVKQYIESTLVAECFHNHVGFARGKITNHLLDSYGATTTIYHSSGELVGSSKTIH